MVPLTYLTRMASMVTGRILMLFLIIEIPRVSSELVNVAIGKNTSQSGDIWPSRNAVDGKKECMPADKQHFTLTPDSHLPWWEVNLGDQYRIQEIIVHGRHDATTTQLHGFRLYLSSDHNFPTNKVVYTNKDYNNGTIIVPKNWTGLHQFVKLDLPDTYRNPLTDDSTTKQQGPIVLCEVEVFVNMTNIALKKHATMSSQYENMAASYSVDGKPGRDANTCNCCSHSQNEPDPWLKIDLLQSYRIYLITVIGRSDNSRENRMLGGLEIYADNSQNLAVGNYTIVHDNVVTLSLPSGLIARNVTLRRPGNGEWYLVVCQMKIYTRVLECQTGTYKDYKVVQCKSCGHCKTETCDKENGSCPEGKCMAGWTGTECNTECEVGQYGENCSENCTGNCFNGSNQCSKVDGKCQQGCIKGYHGEMCKSQCRSSAFSYNCNATCSTCNHMQCTSTDGECLNGCVPGYKPTDRYCHQVCDDGFYGQNCLHQCTGQCKGGNTQCNKSDGKCMQGCNAGYTGERCEAKCQAPAFGKNCSLTCGNCKWKLCRNTDGLCSNGCVPGYKPDDQYCNTTCAAGTYGQNCSGSCSGHCLNGDEKCARTNGTCLQGCDKGYSGDRCETKCPSGLYGSGCPEHCHQCKKGTVCDFRSGHCPDGCNLGFEGDLCDSECQEGFFGDCSHRCHCMDNMTCSKTDGVCTRGCAFGWNGKNCSIDLNLIPHLSNVVTNQTGIFQTYDSTKAIDGKERYDLDNCNCCSVTDGVVPSWWQIDLGDKYLIDTVKIYGRGNIGINNYQLEHATVYASNQTMVNNNVSQTFIYRIPTITTSTVFTHHLNKSIIAQFFIVRSDQKILTICEFKLFWKVCTVGQFGTGCNHFCHCSDNKSCDSVTGKCKGSECFPGWIGESCNLKCKSRSFGKNCSQTCHCINGTNCDNVNGQCYEQECDPGWKGASCQTKCESRSFGKNCSQTCHCINGTNCDHVNGQCDVQECEAGWIDASCETKCKSRSFGKNCNQTCHCINETYCDNVNGQCDEQECDPGWTGLSCQTERQVSEEPSGSSGSSSAAIGAGIGAAVAVVIIAVIIGFIVYRRRNVKESSEKTSKFTNLDKALDSRKQRLSERNASSITARVNRSFEEEDETALNQPGSGDYYSFGENFGGIRIYELWDCIKEKMENECEKFYSEFRKLPSGLVHPCKSADNLLNKGKNRYKEMYAYDHTRVVLLDVEEGKNTDYINACYIDGYDKTKKFVASQGPTKQMINDFWRMVWQLKSDKIVMLTNLIEMGTVKCLQYWPLEDEEDEHCFGNVIVRVLKTETFLDYNIRLFEVRKNGESARKIRQYHFKSWPDKDVPDSTWCLVNFWRAVNTDEPSTAGPIVVHCSAGVGRTGTFIALDNLVAQAKAEDCARPLQIVETLRRQRVNMVQTREQYVYLHEAVADALLFGTHFVFTKQFGEMFSFMLQKGKGETKCNLEKQFELIEKSARDMTSAGAAENVEYTNVETIQSESAAYRPKLKNRGSKFVQELGAMYIPNYKGKNTFLISMSPDKNTMEEFWSLVDDSHIKTVIMLTETSAACYQASCQLGANPKNGSKFSVNKIEEKIRKGFTERSFTFKESDREEEEYLTTVKQFEFTDWKDGSNVPGETRHMLEMINSVQKWQSHLSESQPILIHCSDGCKRSGIVCVLLNELQRILYEGGHINILESVKMMKKRQKYLIPTYEQYRFCFDLMLAHSKTTEVYENL